MYTFQISRNETIYRQVNIKVDVYKDDVYIGVFALTPDYVKWDPIHSEWQKFSCKKTFTKPKNGFMVATVEEATKFADVINTVNSTLNNVADSDDYERMNEEDIHFYDYFGEEVVGIAFAEAMKIVLPVGHKLREGLPDWRIQ